MGRALLSARERRGRTEVGDESGSVDPLSRGNSPPAAARAVRRIEFSSWRMRDGHVRDRRAGKCRWDERWSSTFPRAHCCALTHVDAVTCDVPTLRQKSRSRFSNDGLVRSSDAISTGGVYLRSGGMKSGDLGHRSAFVCGHHRARARFRHGRVSIPPIGRRCSAELCARRASHRKHVWWRSRRTVMESDRSCDAHHIGCSPYRGCSAFFAMRCAAARHVCGQ